MLQVVQVVELIDQAEITLLDQLWLILVLELEELQPVLLAQMLLLIQDLEVAVLVVEQQIGQVQAATAVVE